MLDLVIAGGQVLDGKGSPPIRADVGLRGDRIADVGDLAAADAKAVLRADGKYVSPGFIDAHSHSDAYILIEPSAPSKLSQGVTTEVVGNCGASAAPRTGRYQMPSDWREKHYPGTWSTVGEYRRLLEEVGPGVNIRLLIGHNTVRACVMGYEDRAATVDDLAAMGRLLEQALDEGAAGFSTGLVYSPGMFASRDEIVELARVVAGRGGIYTSHMRNEAVRLLEAIDETLDIGRRAGCRVEISHLKTGGAKSWSLADAALEKIEAARGGGQQVAADRYPYTAGCTDLDIVLPEWASGGGREEVLRRLRDPATRARIREDLAASRSDEDWKLIMIGSTRHPDNARFRGARLVEVAAALGLEPVDALLHLIDTDDLYTGGIFFGMSEENMWKILARPWVMLGSDASIRALDGPLSKDFPHPRAFGTFPRFLRAALDGKTVALSEAVRKMTSLPAAQFGLKDRGVLERGAFADIVVFDPAVVRDTATYEEPRRLAEGIDAVVVNGVVTTRDGKPTGSRAGRFVG